MPRRIVRLAAAILAAAALLCGPAEAATLRVGSLELRRCDRAWCGTLERPLDPARPSGRRIEIFFRWFPASRRADGPALVAVEGGPGYPSTGSKVEYRGIYGPLLAERDLLLVDARGTGGSGLIECPSVQSFTGRTSGSAFARRAGRCARTIDARFGPHASGIFATAYASDDLAALIRALRLGRIDLYGDSYGSFFAQDFMARHPRLVHSVVLDSAYPRRDLDPWYASSGTTARAALDTVAPGAVARLAELLQRVRERPLTGRTRDADSTPLGARVDPRALADMVQDSASDPVILRELDASVQAALAGDTVPLLRLAAQANSWNHTPSDADYFSRGHYLAVACSDYPQLSSPAPRPPGAFAPFTTAEWLTISGFSQPYDVCLNWPKPARRPPPVPAVKLPASVPVLIIGGDLDSLTPLADAHEYGPRLGANVRIVTVGNTAHVTSEGDTYLVEGMRCARRIIRAFIRSAPDPSCTVPAIHTPVYPLTLAAAPPATLASGADPGVAARRAATVAAGALADATIRRVYSFADRGPGLRGGRFSATGDRVVTFKLDGVRFVTDAAVDGTGTWRPATGEVTGTLTVAGVTVRVHWTQATASATATIGGSILTLPAP